LFLNAPEAPPSREDPEAEGNQRQGGIAEPDKGDTGWRSSLGDQVTVREEGCRERFRSVTPACFML
jgi:hypothetical protein